MSQLSFFESEIERLESLIKKSDADTVSISTQTLELDLDEAYSDSHLVIPPKLQLLKMIKVYIIQNLFSVCF